MNQVYSKVTSKSQTVIPKDVRKRLGIRPGDRLRYLMTSKGVMLERVEGAAEDDPFNLFSEWSSAADEKAYEKL